MEGVSDRSPDGLAAPAPCGAGADWPRSRRLFEQALQVMPGGVNSPVRAFQHVGGAPFFVARAQGAYLYDEDGHRYIDYVCSWGPLILGHAHPVVVEAVREAAGRGTSYGAPTAAEVELAELVRRAFPSMEMVRMVNSGTEATMSALRLARAATGRPRFIKFSGNYHGHADSFLVQAGSGATTLGVPDSPGVPAAVAADTLVAPYNDLDAVETLFRQQGDQIAAVIVEPVAANMGVVPPQEGFLAGLRRLTSQYGALLIFDEVITGFRVAFGGAQELYKIRPDLTTLGKIVGGGLPVGAYGGRRDLMAKVAPSGPVYQAGTLAGNPLAMAAGLATLRILAEQKDTIYTELSRRTARLVAGLERAARAAGVPVQLPQVGSLFGIFFSRQPVRDYQGALASSGEAYRRFFWRMLASGCYFAPSPFEAAFVSAAHGDAEIQTTLDAARDAFQAAAEAL
ncbi:MAG: glutamate-1-semialdehyde 2,1-aminomutase [Firmicutes bacterium]|nr:glutamate-1-semialdehyde 2,1-aminomutase [Bacillota bacterium]